jgi:hypothetical protein
MIVCGQIYVSHDINQCEAHVNMGCMKLTLVLLMWRIG